MVTRSLSFRKACVGVGVGVWVRVGMRVYARVTPSRAQSRIDFFLHVRLIRDGSAT